MGKTNRVKKRKTAAKNARPPKRVEVFAVHCPREPGTKPRRSLASASGGVTYHFAMKLRSLLVLSSLLAFFTSAASAAPLNVGDAAPLISATTDAGTTLNLSDVYAKNTYTLVYFYPKADTPGCTKQGCSLRDANTDLAAKGVAIIGVSTDSVAAQKAFKEKYNFPFTLLADSDKKVLKAFGQSAVKFASREAYLIKGGKIVYKDTGVTAEQGQNILKYLASAKS